MALVLVWRSDRWMFASFRHRAGPQQETKIIAVTCRVPHSFARNANGWGTRLNRFLCGESSVNRGHEGSEGIPAHGRSCSSAPIHADQDTVDRWVQSNIETSTEMSLPFDLPAFLPARVRQTRSVPSPATAYTRNARQYGDGKYGTNTGTDGMFPSSLPKEGFRASRSRGTIRLTLHFPPAFPHSFAGNANEWHPAPQRTCRSASRRTSDLKTDGF